MEDAKRSPLFFGRMDFSEQYRIEGES